MSARARLVAGAGLGGTMGALLLVASSASAQQPSGTTVLDGGVTLEYVPAVGPASAPAAAAPTAGPSVAPSAAAGAAAPPHEVETEERKARTLRPAFRGVGGFQYEQIDGIPVTAGRGRVAFGAQNDTMGHYGSLTVGYGSTQNGLRTFDVRFGWIGDLLRYSIIRVGLDVDVGYLWLHRATTTEHLWALGILGGAHAVLDLFTWGPRDDHAIILEGRFDVGAYFGGTYTWGPTVMVGFRY